MPTLTIINCKRFDPFKVCEVLGEVPTLKTCMTCQQRDPLRSPLRSPILFGEATPRQPAPEDPNRTVTICEWRIRENYNAQGQAVLLAGRVDVFDGKWEVTRAAHIAAQAHRT